MLILSLCLYFTLFTCGLAIALVIVRYDLYEREPWPMLVLAAVLGACGMWVAGEMQISMIRALHSNGHEIGNVLLAAMAGSTEEFAKFAVVAILCAAIPRFFNEPLDGLIYGSFVGLGAALEESVAVLSSSSINGYLPASEPVRLAGHLVMGGIAAFGLGLFPSRKWLAIPASVCCLGVAAALHTAWDVAAFEASDHYRLHDRLLGWHTAIPVALMLTGMVAYRRLIATGARLTRNLLNVCDVRTRQCPDVRPG